MTETTKQQYLVNLLETGLDLKSGAINIPVGGYIKIRDSELTHPTIEWALDRNWAEVTDKIPTRSKQVIEIEYQELPDGKGISEAELLASQVPTPVAAETKPVTPAPAKKAEKAKPAVAETTK